MANTNKCDIVGDKVKVVTNEVKQTEADGIATIAFDDVDTVSFEDSSSTLSFTADGQTYSTTYDDTGTNPKVFTVTGIDET